MVQTLTVAVCICNGVTLSDFVPPIEILSGVNLADTPMMGDLLKGVPYRLAIDYIAPTKEPIHALMQTSLPTVNPTHTYNEVTTKGIQYDIIWIPAGPLTNPVTGKNATPTEQIDFIRKQAPGAKYILSVCGGSLQLAMAGLLEGKRATTNKAFFRAIVNETSKNIHWVPKARWVVDGKIWTSSGVAAGSDMALAFLEHLVGKKYSQVIRGSVEIPEVNGSEDDPFAAIHGLV